MTRREQLAIALAIPAVGVLTRLVIALAAAAFTSHQLREELVALTMTVALFVPFPLAVPAMTRAVGMRRRSMEIAVLVVFSCTAALVSHLWRWVVLPADLQWFYRFGWIHLRLYAPAFAVFLSLTAHFIAALQQHRRAMEEDARRFEAEAESARRARRSVERQMKPDQVVATLQEVASRSVSDPGEAERLLLRLARRQRLLLRQPPPAEPAAEPSPAPETGAPGVAMPLVPASYPLLVYLAAVVEFDLGTVEWMMSWNSLVMTLVSAACWVVVGPVLYRAIRGIVALRLPLAIAAALGGVMAAALSVTAVSAVAVYALARDGMAELFDWNLSVLAWRNSLPALVVAASALMTAYTGVMSAARAAAARARNETVRAETRALEDRFHPHFLFNALNSIAAFIREDRHAAARMCRQLAALVGRTVASAGERSWAIEHELALIDEYLAIQRIRFGGRLAIDHWDVAPEVRERPIPRLMLQPLLENIFKHAVAASAAPIHAGLTIGKRGRGIEICLWNSLAGLGAPPRFGRGLAFVSGRVRDVDGTLTIDRAGGRFAIRCFLPARS